MIELYRSYKEKNDTQAGEQVAGYLYRQLNFWIEYGKPEEAFLDEFWQLWAESQEFLDTQGDLIDLGLAQTAESLSLYREDLEKPALSEFYIYEARLPFFAYLDEQSYRMTKNIEFSEIDFHIFEIIGGQFPHEVAQNFLKENEWADIWSALRYLDSIDDISGRYAILSNMLERRKTVQEKLIILAYIIFSDRSAVENAGDGHDLTLPTEFSPELVQSILNITDDAQGRGLAVDFEQKIPDRFENETIFFLLALFEITQTELSPSWIRVLELGLTRIWTYPFPELDGTVRIHQPMQEFTASILSLLSDDDLQEVIGTSLVLPAFFANLDRYNTETFLHLLGTFSRYEEQLLHELMIAMPGNVDREREEDFLHGRLQEIATHLGREIKLQNGVPLLRHSDGSIN